MYYVSKASVHDIHYLHDVQEQLSCCTLLEEKRYVSQQWQANLFDIKAINLETFMRKNQKDFKVLHAGSRLKLPRLHSFNGAA